MAAYSLIAIQLRDARRHKHLGTKTSIAQPDVGSFTSNTLPDSEHFVSIHEERFMPERREYKDGMWQLEPGFVQHHPERPRAPRTVYAPRAHADGVLRQAVRAVLEEGGSPNEVTVVIREKKR
jgi:hypothetical protein